MIEISIKDNKTIFTEEEFYELYNKVDILYNRLERKRLRKNNMYNFKLDKRKRVDDSEVEKYLDLSIKTFYNYFLNKIDKNDKTLYNSIINRISE